MFFSVAHSAHILTILDAWIKWKKKSDSLHGIQNCLFNSEYVSIFIKKLRSHLIIYLNIETFVYYRLDVNTLPTAKFSTQFQVCILLLSTFWPLNTQRKKKDKKQEQNRVSKQNFHFLKILKLNRSKRFVYLFLYIAASILLMYTILFVVV